MNARARSRDRGGTALDVVPLEQTDTEEVTALLQAVFGPDMTLDAYRWKHHDNPAGSSIGWVARDREGLVGVRALMRWRLSAGDATITAVRPVDTATAPRARGRGVFRTLTEHTLRELRADAGRGPQLVFNTPNDNSRPGYVKSGWTLLPRVRHVITPSLAVARARLEEDAQALESIARSSQRSAGIRSERTLPWLVWRYDGRSGNSYRAVRLHTGETPNGLVYRITTQRGLRLLVVCELGGEVGDRRRLVGAACAAERARAVLTVAGPGTEPQVRRLGVPRGGSTIAALPLATIHPDPLELDSWSVTFGDLERVL